jgi:hypothetical protein
MEVDRSKAGKVELEEFLSRPLLAHIASSSDFGARNSLFWFLWEDGALWFILEEGFNTLQSRVQEDPRVAVGLADFDPKRGFLEHVSIRGRASVEGWDDARARRLLRRYYRFLDGYVEPPVNPGEKVTGRLPMTFLKIVPESVVIRDHTYRDNVVERSH